MKKLKIEHRWINSNTMTYQAKNNGKADTSSSIFAFKVEFTVTNMSVKVNMGSSSN